MKSQKSILLSFLVVKLVWSVGASRECCRELEVSSNAMTIAGSFKVRGEWAERPVYSSPDHDIFLHFVPLRVGGVWTIGAHIGEVGVLGHLGQGDCPEDLAPGGWKYRVGSAWLLDQNIKTRCLDREQDIDVNIQEIKGKFTMKSMTLSDNVRNTESDDFKQMSKSIENGLMNMLTEEEDLDQKMDFQVAVEEIKVDNSEVDFKILYNMKDSFLAVPFELKPVNLSDVLHKDFKLRKGILFEKFPVDTDSFECSGSDPCADLGCSHKCGYDYSRQDYTCTCPAHLALAGDERRCVSEQGDDIRDQEATTENVVSEETTSPFTTSTTTSPAFSPASTTPGPCSHGAGCSIGSDEESTSRRGPEDDIESNTVNDEVQTTTTTARPGGFVYHHVGFIHRDQGEDQHRNYFPHVYGHNQKQTTSSKPDVSVTITNFEGRNKDKETTTTVSKSDTNSNSTTAPMNVEMTSDTTQRSYVEMNSPATGPSVGVTGPPMTVGMRQSNTAATSSSKDSKIILPIIIDRFSPHHHHHDKTRTRENYHDDMENMAVMMTQDGQNVGVVKMKPNLSISPSSNSSSAESADNLPDSVFMFDCVKAYNDNIDKGMAQEVLKCKMADKGDGEDVFIVVDKKVLKKTETP